MIRVPAGTRLVLASSSPRRAALLESVGLEFEVRPADIDETPRSDEAPLEYVRRLAHHKATVAAGHEASVGEAVVAADTTVELAGAILGKPGDDEDAARMLRALSGRTHHVHTAVTVVAPPRPQKPAGAAAHPTVHRAVRPSTQPGTRTIVVTTAVTFVALDDATICAYLATGESRGKAGAYALQGAGGALVERVEGSVSNVIGLPLAETLALLRNL